MPKKGRPSTRSPIGACATIASLSPSGFLLGGGGGLRLVASTGPLLRLPVGTCWYHVPILGLPQGRLKTSPSPRLSPSDLQEELLPAMRSIAGLVCDRLKLRTQGAFCCWTLGLLRSSSLSKMAMVQGHAAELQSHTRLIGV